VKKKQPPSEAHVTGPSVRIPEETEKRKWDYLRAEFHAYGLQVGHMEKTLEETIHGHIKRLRELSSFMDDSFESMEATMEMQYQLLNENKRLWKERDALLDRCENLVAYVSGLPELPQEMVELINDHVAEGRPEGS